MHKDDKEANKIVKDTIQALKEIAGLNINKK